MNSLFDVQYNTEIINRINKLTPDTKPLWGKMTVAQMMAHCIEGFRSAYGEIKLKRSFIGILFGGMAKKSVMGDKPFKRDLPTDKNFIIRYERNFEEEKNKLTAYVKKFEVRALTKDTHPFFGKMTTDEWDKLMVKHLDHHLRQFGV
jgi:hypothetical protein